MDPLPYSEFVPAESGMSFDLVSASFLDTHMSFTKVDLTEPYPADLMRNAPIIESLKADLTKGTYVIIMEVDHVRYKYPTQQIRFLFLRASLSTIVMGQ